MGPNNMTGILIKDQDTGTEGQPCEGDNHHKLRRGVSGETTPVVSNTLRTVSFQYLDIGLLASRAVKQNISVVEPYHPSKGTQTSFQSIDAVRHPLPRWLHS